MAHLSTPQDLITWNYNPISFPVIFIQGPGTLRLQAMQHVGACCIELFKDVSMVPKPAMSVVDGAHPAPHK